MAWSGVHNHHEVLLDGDSGVVPCSELDRHSERLDESESSTRGRSNKYCYALITLYLPANCCEPRKSQVLLNLLRYHRSSVTANI